MTGRKGLTAPKDDMRGITQVILSFSETVVLTTNNTPEALTFLGLRMEDRLQNILASSGIASRRASAQIIEKGLVTIDGKIVREKGLRLDPTEHKIKVDGKILGPVEEKRYFLFNKPSGIISTVADTHGRRKITDFFKDINERLYPVGRLDKDTTGIIILTNDGDLAHILSHPSFEVSKEYRAEVTKPLEEEEIKKISKGIRVEGVRYSPCGIRRIRSGPDKIVYSVELHEGRKRQVRKMFASVGADVISLERVRYAGLTSKGLKKGMRRELTREEVLELRTIASGGKRKNTQKRSKDPRARDAGSAKSRVGHSRKQEGRKRKP